MIDGVRLGPSLGNVVDGGVVEGENEGEKLVDDGFMVGEAVSATLGNEVDGLVVGRTVGTGQFNTVNSRPPVIKTFASFSQYDCDLF